MLLTYIRAMIQFSNCGRLSRIVQPLDVDSVSAENF